MDAPGAVRLHDGHGKVYDSPPCHRATLRVMKHKHALSLVADIPGHGGTVVALPTAANFANLEELELIIVLGKIDDHDMPLNLDLVLWNRRPSPIEVHEQRVRSAVKLLCKLKLLEDKVQWLFPESCHVMKLMDPEELEGCVGDDQTRNSENQSLGALLLDQDASASTIQVPNVSNPDVEVGSVA
ncbi:hypothetical protein Sjap_011203 [Stephania japonica]|uniref:Uncharacterized protein n=1 Tax=Stephania japonica TaxID=461633 RepID=A0AAP0JAX0_9MAGN